MSLQTAAETLEAELRDKHAETINTEAWEIEQPVDYLSAPTGWSIQSGLLASH